MEYTHEIVGTHGGGLLPERAPEHALGAKSFVCTGLIKGLCDEMCRNLIKIQSLGTASKLRGIFVSHEAVIFAVCE